MFYGRAIYSRGFKGRAREADGVITAAFPPDENPLTFACGPTRLIEAVATQLQELRYKPERIKTERFGPTGRRPGGGFPSETGKRRWMNDELADRETSTELPKPAGEFRVPVSIQWLKPYPRQIAVNLK